MSYQVLARKWRPRDFGSLVGQEHVVRALWHALENQRLHHAYLFTGTRGVGKTTLARILAKAFNCEQGVGASPCGTCSACAGIDAGPEPSFELGPHEGEQFDPEDRQKRPECGA